MLRRLIYSDPAATFSMPIDLIPFRGVASADGRIEWPPSRDIVMNVAGFEEALVSSASIEMEMDLIIRVASLPGLTLLKLIAWSDRGDQTNKDAADLYRLLTSCAEVGNTDRLYDRELDLLESVDFDMQLAAAELLARDVRGCAHPSVCPNSIAPQLDLERLVNQMAQTTYAEARPAVERTIALFSRGLLADESGSSDPRTGCRTRKESPGCFPGLCSLQYWSD